MFEGTPTEKARRKKADSCLERLTRRAEVEADPKTKQGMKKIKGGVKS